LEHLLEEKLTNSDPFITSTDKHSIYPQKVYFQRTGPFGLSSSTLC
jgi:hypothetical protein